MLIKIILILISIVISTQTWAVYDLPDTTCPANCRKISWSAGLDPEGGIPNRSIGKNAVIDYGADNTGVNSASTAIQNCLNGTAIDTACYLPAGTYRLTASISIPSNKTLRGAGPSLTILMVYSGSGGITMVGTGGWGPGRNIATTPAKNDTSLILTGTSLGLSVDDWVSIYQANSESFVTTMVSYTCGQSFEDGSTSGQNCMQQFAKVTSVSEAGGNTTIGINRPLYWGFNTSYSAQVKKIAWPIVKAGIEDLKIDGTNNAVNHISFRDARHCWIKNIESYNCCDANGEAHVQARWTHGIEIRDSYFHTGQSHDSGANYGLFAYNWNSDFKIENNIYYDLRHAVMFEGGASGSAVLYNYMDGCYESQAGASHTLTVDAGASHAAHPFMNLWEGNIVSQIRADSWMGSSSHTVLFRNWVRGWSSGAQFIPSDQDWDEVAIRLMENQYYYSAIGNVLGRSAWTSGTVVDTVCTYTEPIAYLLGCPDGDATTNSTLIKHGNYDYVGDSVAHWDGGADHTLKSSMYYSYKPSFFGGLTWPPMGPDVSGYTNDIPAKVFYDTGVWPSSGPSSVQGLTIQGGTLK